MAFNALPNIFMIPAISADLAPRWRGPVCNYEGVSEVQTTPRETATALRVQRPRPTTLPSSGRRHGGWVRGLAGSRV